MQVISEPHPATHVCFQPKEVPHGKKKARHMFCLLQQRSPSSSSTTNVTIFSVQQKKVFRRRYHKHMFCNERKVSLFCKKKQYHSSTKNLLIETKTEKKGVTTVNQLIERFLVGDKREERRAWICLEPSQSSVRLSLEPSHATRHSPCFPMKPTISLPESLVH